MRGTKAKLLRKTARGTAEALFPHERQAVRDHIAEGMYKRIKKLTKARRV